MILASVLRSLRIDLDQVSEDQVQLHSEQSYQPLTEEAARWVHRQQRFLSYPLDTEFSTSPAGFVLRNLHLEQGKSIHTDLHPDSQRSPVFYGFRHNLEQIWQRGVVIGVEGPKDVLFLSQFRLPAVAYLNAQPRRSQMAVLKRYARTFIWVPDGDIFTHAKHKQSSELSVRMLKQEWGVNFQLFRIDDDPANASIPEIQLLCRKYQTA